MSKVISFQKLREIALDCGLTLVSTTDSAPLEEEKKRLKQWQELGYAGELSYMKRGPELFVDPTLLSGGAKSVVTFAVHYSRAQKPERKTGYGRVARYAWGKDYHKVLKRRLLKLLPKVEQELRASLNVRVFTDAVPLLERAFASKSGLGFIGKNTMLITPGRGSFSLLGEILWDVVISDKPTMLGGKGSCGSCRRCLSACPTEAFVAPYVLDARKCISYLTIEKRGALSLWEREALGEWVFGCDICQDICPFNHTSLKNEESAELSELDSSCGVGGVICLEDVLSIKSEQEYLSRFAGTPLMRAKREGLLRNAAIVAKNTHCAELSNVLAQVSLEDPNPIVRQHALWAFAKMHVEDNLGPRDKIVQHLEKCLDDDSQGVQQEGRDLLICI